MKRLQPSKQFLPTLNDNDVNANQRLSSHTQTHGQPDDESSTPESNISLPQVGQNYCMHRLVDHSTVEELLNSFNKEEEEEDEQLDQSTKKNKTKK